MRSDGNCDVLALDDRLVSWPSPVEWACELLNEWQMDTQGPASDFINDMTMCASHGAVEALAVLAEQASGDPELLDLVGAGPLEDLLSHSAHGAVVVRAVEVAANERPALKGALASVWLGAQVAGDVRVRLVNLGARDLTKPKT